MNVPAGPVDERVKRIMVEACRRAMAEAPEVQAIAFSVASEVISADRLATTFVGAEGQITDLGVWFQLCRVLTDGQAYAAANVRGLLDGLQELSEAISRRINESQGIEATGERTSGRGGGATGPAADQAGPAALETIGQLTARIGIVDWDVIIVGDGGGQGWGQPCGCAAVVIERATAARRVFFGGFNDGTVALAEVIPYFWALLWYTHADGPGERLQRQLHRNRQVQVHVITDSKVTATMGEELYAGRRGCATIKANAAVWAGMAHFGRVGYDVRFHHQRREVVALNCLADEIADAGKSAVFGLSRLVDGVRRSLDTIDAVGDYAGRARTYNPDDPETPREVVVGPRPKRPGARPPGPHPRRPL